jgi:serine/threonine protein kinase
MRLSAGTRLGPYEIVALIGAGGMGEVYRAHDTKLESRRRDQSADGSPGERQGTARTFHARSADGGGAESPEHRGHLRLRRKRRTCGAGWSCFFNDAGFVQVAGSACSDLYRGLRLWEAAVKEAGSLQRMNMYIAQAKNGHFEIVKSLGVIDPKEQSVR